MQIKFSHHYPKLWNQRWAELVAVKLVRAKDVASNLELVEYDTGYDDHGRKGYYPLPEEGWLLQLIFLGDKHIPFCTLRSHNLEKEDYYKKLIGKIFDIRVGSEIKWEKN